MRITLQNKKSDDPRRSVPAVSLVRPREHSTTEDVTCLRAGFAASQEIHYIYAAAKSVGTVGRFHLVGRSSCLLHETSGRLFPPALRFFVRLHDGFGRMKLAHFL